VTKTGAHHAEIAFSDRFLAQLRSMDKAKFAEVQRMIERFHANSRSAALDLEHYNGSLDGRFRTMRASQAIRAIVWALDAGVYLLDEVVYNHEEAERASRNRRCMVGDASGIVRIVRTTETVEDGAKEGEVRALADDRLFDDAGIRALDRLRLNEDVRQVVVSFTVVEQLDALARLIPGYAREVKAAYMIACAYSDEEAWAELTADQEPAGQGRGLAGIHIIRSETELQAVFSKPLLVWRTFLHRSQEELAHRARFNGPVRVIGGPGTGKTVVAVHRARYLAIAQRAVKGRRGVLLTAFSRTLVESIQDCLVDLLDGETAQGIKVANIDAVVAQLCAECDLEPVNIIEDGSVIDARITDAIARAGTRFTPIQVRLEWEDTVLAHQVWTEEAYLAVRREGAGRGMHSTERRAMWRTILALHEVLDEHGEATHLSRADALARELAARPRTFFDHAIIDESQDLHPVHWRLLRAIVPTGPNDLFLVGDVNQQIFRRPFSLMSAGISTRSRVRRLGINYRTSAGIVTWARRILEQATPRDPDGTDVSLDNYVSLIDGPLPELRGFSSPEEEQRAIVTQIQAWIAQGIEPGSIAVICRDLGQCHRYENALRTAKVKTVSATTMGRGAREGVAVITMHRSKGLEFRAVAIPEVGKDRYPVAPPKSFAEDGDSGLQQWEDQERRLLFVACTRPRELLWVSWTKAPSPMLPLLR
jgi:superfamily I DNA/RNA helicase